MRLARGVLLGVAIFLLLSMGGAVVAAPVTLPLLVLAARSTPSNGYRIAAAVVAGLTAAEVAWAVVYVTVGEQSPTIWLLPVLVGIAVLALVPRLRRPVLA
ncbi:MAG TPA: hypothetical protein VK507_07800 [Iamia sp.]|nr:hypothetical protein [Iamia sp.]